MSGKLITLTQEELEVLVRDVYGEGVIDGACSSCDQWHDSESKKELNNIIEGK